MARQRLRRQYRSRRRLLTSMWRQARRAASSTQQEVATDACVYLSKLSRYERGCDPGSVALGGAEVLELSVGSGRWTRCPF